MAAHRAEVLSSDSTFTPWQNLFVHQPNKDEELESLHQSISIIIFILDTGVDVFGQIYPQIVICANFFPIITLDTTATWLLTTGNTIIRLSYSSLAIP